MQTYELMVQFKSKSDITHKIKANNVEEVRKWALENVDTSQRWVICLDGKFKDYAVEREIYRADGENEELRKYKSHTTDNKNGWFDTKEKAKEDYQENKLKSEKELDTIEKEFNNLKQRLGCDIGYKIDGDTQGIDEHYLYISIEVNDYEFYRKIEG